MKWVLVLWLGIGSGAAAETAQAQRTILVLGDSISAAYQIDTEAGWVSLLQQKLNEEYEHWQVLNASVSGDTTLDGLTRVDGLLVDVKPQIMILELGANDGLRGYPIEAIRANLITLIEKAQKAGAFVVLAGMQLPQNYGPKYLDEFKNLFSDLSKEKNTGLIPFLMDGVATEETLMQDDGLHPNAEGQPGLLANVWPILKGHIDEHNERIN